MVTMVRNHQRSVADGQQHRRRAGGWVAVVWLAFVVGALALLDVVDLTWWGVVVPAAALVLAAVPGLRPSLSWSPRIGDLAAIAVCYLAVVGLFRLAFEGFTTDRVAGLFLSFAAGLLVGVIGPLGYQVWWKGGALADLGLSWDRLGATAAVGVVLAGVQFTMTLWGYDLPEPVDWVPLLVMSLVVGFFEAVFFRGFVQGRLDVSFGSGPAVAVAALLYSLYHVGYGMGADEMVFLFGLGVVYAIAYRLVTNILVLWPLLTPLGAFFNNLEAGDIDLPWASIAGFADVAAVMAAAIWFTRRHERKRTERLTKEEAT